MHSVDSEKGTKLGNNICLTYELLQVGFFLGLNAISRRGRCRDTSCSTSTSTNTPGTGEKHIPGHMYSVCRMEQRPKRLWFMNFQSAAANIFRA